MKNLFDYATKELSQDAFLRWLFENYNCENEDVKKVCEKILSEFTGIKDFDIRKVSRLQTKAQFNKIDILVDFKYESRVFCVAIEDKVFSEEHSGQLTRYEQSINRYSDELKRDYQCSDVTIKRIYYKTAKLSYTEKKRVENSGWKIFDIENIKNLFQGTDPINSEVLDYYIDHVLKVYKLFYCYETIPVTEWDKNYIPFTSYSYDLFKKYAVDISEKECRTEIYQGKYAQTFIQKNLSNNITVELGLFFRPCGCTAWIKIWNTESGYKSLCLQREEIYRLCVRNIRINWNNKQRKNRIKIAKKDFTADVSYIEFNDWTENCVKDYLDYVRIIESVPKLG